MSLLIYIAKEGVLVELTKEELKIVFDSLMELYAERPLTDKEADLYIKIRKQL
jgi:hypothetical protein